MKTEFLRWCVVPLLSAGAVFAGTPEVIDSSPLHDKAAYLQRDLLDKHWLDGLYVSIVPSAPPGTTLPHTVNQPGNVIHSGVWTGRYLAGVGYQYAVTQDPWARQNGGAILRALRTLQEVTGKPGLLARGYVKGHGPVEDWERNGQDSPEWHQGQGKFSDYRWHGDVSVDNFNAVLYGYAIYFDLAADTEQRQLIAEDVDKLMTHLLENHCRIIDVDGEVTKWGHVGIDPDPARDEYYRKVYAARLKRDSLRTDIERNPFARGEALSARPIPINQRPLDNEYAWKGNPYQLDNWFKPIITMFQSSCDDPLVAWFSDSTGAVFITLDGGKDWHDVSAGLRGARVQNIAASNQRTFIIYAQTDQGPFLSRDGGLSWRPVPEKETVKFPSVDFKQWLRVFDNLFCRITEQGQFEISRDHGQTAAPSMKGWRIPRAASFFVTSSGVIASGLGGCYQSVDGENWTELKLWRENETGAADFLHAYWMGRFYGYIKSTE